MAKKTIKKSASKKAAKVPTWNLGLFYKSPEDPQIEKDMEEIEDAATTFAKKYNTAEKKYLENADELVAALKDYENIAPLFDWKPLLYLHRARDIDATNKKVGSLLALLSNRAAKVINTIQFFDLALGKIDPARQKEFLNNPKLAHFKVFLSRRFSDAKHLLTDAEEKIINLKSLPAHEMWSSAHEKFLNQQFVEWKGKKLPMYEAQQLVPKTLNKNERYKLHALINEKLKSVAHMSEGELNALYTDKKIEDELRGYATPHASTVRAYRNDPTVVEGLVKLITESFPIAHRFYKLKAKMLKLNKLSYADRAVKSGVVNVKFSFEESLEQLKTIFGELDPKYARILDEYVKNGQIDVLPRIGKTGGAYCAGAHSQPTFVLLNHTNSLNAFSTFAHEMGHAFHTEFSKSQSPLYSDYSTSLAETASTLFEAIASDAVFDKLSEKEKTIVLHDRIIDDIATVFRQIACFNLEADLHTAVRAKGFLSKEEIAEIHNKNMKAYLGPQFNFTEGDGYFFVTWGHLRWSFYVYTYTYGQLVSKAMLRRYRQDKSFWSSIEKFLAAGGKASPEEILMEIGIDVTKPDFWKEGLKEIEDDIVKLEKLVSKKK